MSTFQFSKHALIACASLFLSQAAMADDPEALPVCAFGGPYNAECTGASTPVPIDGSGSFDPDGTQITTQWFEECPFGFVDDPTSLQANYVIDMTGQCFRQCFLVLRVTSGNQLVVCGDWVTVTDSTAPSLSLPADVTAPWGTINTTPAGTGFATASDLCDPAPVVTFFDTIIPQQGPGHEQTIIRTWTATDRCNYSVSEDQVITLTSPSAGGNFSLEMDVTTCADVLDRSTPNPRMSFSLLGRPNLKVAQINRTTIRLSRQADPLTFIAPPNPYKYSAQQIGVFAALQFGDCNPQGNDGIADLRLEFSYAELMTVLGLENEPAGTIVPLQIFGNRTNGTPWIAYGQIEVQ